MSSSLENKVINPTRSIYWWLPPYSPNALTERECHISCRHRFNALSQRFSIWNEMPFKGQDSSSLFSALQKFSVLAGKGKISATDILISFDGSEKYDSVFVLCPRWFKDEAVQRVGEIVKGQREELLPDVIPDPKPQTFQGFQSLWRPDLLSNSHQPVIKGGYDGDNQIMFFFDGDVRQSMMALFNVHDIPPYQKKEDRPLFPAKPKLV